MKQVAIIGMGTMGSAIAAVLGEKYQITGLDLGDDLGRATTADILIIAVKPQSFDELSGNLKPHIKQQLVISIMAGIGSPYVIEKLGTDRVVRTMPNLGLAKNKSLTAAYTAANREAANELLAEWGEVLWLDNEADFDAFTALAGSGPAYFFELTAQLQAAAEQLGFDQVTAQQIANRTLASSAAILDDQPAATKVRQVASQGGTTEAALKVFADHKFAETVDQAVRAAAARSKEISDEYR